MTITGITPLPVGMFSALASPVLEPGFQPLSHGLVGPCVREQVTGQRAGLFTRRLSSREINARRFSKIPLISTVVVQGKDSSFPQEPGMGFGALNLGGRANNQRPSDETVISLSNFRIRDVTPVGRGLDKKVFYGEAGRVLSDYFAFGSGTDSKLSVVVTRLGQFYFGLNLMGMYSGSCLSRDDMVEISMKTTTGISSEYLCDKPSGWEREKQLLESGTVCTIFDEFDFSLPVAGSSRELFHVYNDSKVFYPEYATDILHNPNRSTNTLFLDSGEVFKDKPADEEAAHIESNPVRLTYTPEQGYHITALAQITNPEAVKFYSPELNDWIPVFKGNDSGGMVVCGFTPKPGDYIMIYDKIIYLPDIDMSSKQQEPVTHVSGIESYFNSQFRECRSHAIRFDEETGTFDIISREDVGSPFGQEKIKIGIAPGGRYYIIWPYRKRSVLVWESEEGRVWQQVNSRQEARDLKRTTYLKAGLIKIGNYQIRLPQKAPFWWGQPLRITGVCRQTTKIGDYFSEARRSGGVRQVWINLNSQVLLYDKPQHIPSNVNVKTDARIIEETDGYTIYWPKDYPNETLKVFDSYRWRTITPDETMMRDGFRTYRMTKPMGVRFLGLEFNLPDLTKRREEEKRQASQEARDTYNHYAGGAWRSEQSSGQRARRQWSWSGASQGTSRSSSSAAPSRDKVSIMYGLKEQFEICGFKGEFNGGRPSQTILDLNAKQLKRHIVKNYHPDRLGSDTPEAVVELVAKAFDKAMKAYAVICKKLFDAGFKEWKDR